MKEGAGGAGAGGGGADGAPNEEANVAAADAKLDDAFDGEGGAA